MKEDDQFWLELSAHHDFLFELNKKIFILNREISSRELYCFVNAKEGNFEVLRNAVEHLKIVFERIQYEENKPIPFEEKMEQFHLIFRYYKRLVSLIEDTSKSLDPCYRRTN